MRRLSSWLLVVIGVATFIAVNAFGPRYAPALWAATAFTATIVLLGLAVLCAVYRRGERRAFWIGFAAFGTGYLLLTMGPWLGPAIGSHFVTSKLMLAACGVAGPAQQAAEMRIREALDKPADFEFDDTRLDAVVGSIEKDYGINVELDLSVVESLGPEAPITYVGHGITLRSALALMLKQIDSTYRIKHESLIILTTDAAEDIDYGYRGIIPAMVELTPTELLRGGHSLFALLLALIGGLAARRLYATRESKPATTDRPRRRWYQFRLRTLLIVTAFVAVVLAWYISGPLRQSRAVAAIEEANGFVDYARTKPVPAGLREWFGDEYFGRVVAVSLEQCKVDDAGLRPVKGFTSLEAIALNDTQVRGSGLACLRTFRNLQTVSLINTPLEDAALEYLSGLPHLRALYLSDTPIGDAGVERLKDLPELQELSLRGTGVTDSGLRHLTRFSRLRVLDLSDTEITDKGLECLTALAKLRWLNLAGTAVGDAGMVHLERLGNLASLDVFDTNVTVGWAQTHVREFPERAASGWDAAFGWVRPQGAPVMLGLYPLDYTLRRGFADGISPYFVGINKAIRAALMSSQPQERISLRSQGIR